MSATLRLISRKRLGWLATNMLHIFRLLLLNSQQLHHQLVRGNSARCSAGAGLGSRHTQTQTDCGFGTASFRIGRASARLVVPDLLADALLGG